MGGNVKLIAAKPELINETIKPVAYKKDIIENKAATDYKNETLNINASKKLNFHLAPGGGFAIRITKN